MQSNRIRNGIGNLLPQKIKISGCSVIVDGQQIVDDSSSNQPFSDHQPLLQWQGEKIKALPGAIPPRLRRNNDHRCTINCTVSIVFLEASQPHMY